MKTNKKFLSTLLAFSMILTMIQPALAVTISGSLYTPSTFSKIGMHAYSRTLAISDSGYFAAQYSGGNNYLTNLSGESIGSGYLELTYLCQDYFKATNLDGSRNIINTNGEVVYQLYDNDVSVLGDYFWLSSNGFMGSTLEDAQQWIQYDGKNYAFLNRNLESVSIEEAFAGREPSYSDLGIMVNYDSRQETWMSIIDLNGEVIIKEYDAGGPFYSEWNQTIYDLYQTNYNQMLYETFPSTVTALQVSVNDEKFTMFVDYRSGTVYGEMDGFVSNIDENGYYIKEEADGSFAIYQTDEHYWITGGQPPESAETEIQYEQLPNAVAHTSYLTAVYDINNSSSLASGEMPRGIGLYDDGVIGGVPLESGEFKFTIATSTGEVGYSLTVEEPTAFLVEKNNDFEIIERIPTIESNEENYVFEVSGEYSDFLNVYLNGELLVKDVHYFAEEGSTKITIAAQTMGQLDSGSHTINATFGTTNATVTPSTSTSGSTSSGSVTTNSSSKSANVASVAQVFNKTVEPAPMMAMPFADVAVSDWHYQYVRYMYDTGTFSGVTDTTYEPNTGMTRAMMAVVFYGMAGKPSTGSAGFSDVVDGEWYADAVNWISTSGIDDSTGNFRPTDLITREETAKMMHNFCTDQGIFIPLTTSRTPSDMNSVSENAKNAVNVLFSKGIFAGDDANNFNPHNTSTRAEISAMMRTFMWATV